MLLLISVLRFFRNGTFQLQALQSAHYVSITNAMIYVEGRRCKLCLTQVFESELFLRRNLIIILIIAIRCLIWLLTHLKIICRHCTLFWDTISYLCYLRNFQSAEYIIIYGLKLNLTSALTRETRIYLFYLGTFILLGLTRFWYRPDAYIMLCVFRSCILHNFIGTRNIWRCLKSLLIRWRFILLYDIFLFHNIY